MTATIRRWSGAIAFSAILLAGCQSNPTNPLPERFQPKVATRILPVTPDLVVSEGAGSPLSDEEKLQWAELCNRKLDALCGDCDLLFGPSRAAGAQATQEVHILEVRLGARPEGFGFLFMPSHPVPEWVFIGPSWHNQQTIEIRAELRVPGRKPSFYRGYETFGESLFIGVIPPWYERHPGGSAEQAVAYTFRSCLTELFTGKSLREWYMEDLRRLQAPPTKVDKSSTP